MKIFFYAPLKPLGHPHPSGDLAIAAGLVRFLESRGHRVLAASRFRSRGISPRPWRWPQAAAERARARRGLLREQPDLWLTYHSYYKAPDLLGPHASRGICPYVVFQGAYSTKVQRRLSTIAGFYANRAALLRADHVFENRLLDQRNLLRLLPRDRISYVAPGIFPNDFEHSARHRDLLRKAWGAEEKPVVLTAAMFRPGVKARGLALTIRACGMLAREGLDLMLAIAGDGEAADELRALARQELPGRHLFLGRVPRKEMHRVYSAADLFAFPGIRESLGMVYLEAQSCGLPVAAFANGGIPEVVQRNVTGLLTPLHDLPAFANAISLLCSDASLRREMGKAGAERVRRVHDLDRNYREMEEKLLEIVQRFKAGKNKS